MIELYQAGWLAMLQGFTEFLAVAGSAWPLIPAVLPGFSDQRLAFDAAVQVGAPCAAVRYHRAEILCMAHQWSRSPGGGPACGERGHYLDSSP